MKNKDVRVVKREELYRGFMKIARYRLSHQLHRGGWSPEIVRERVEGLRAASVLLYDPGLDAVVLVEQFRIWALEAGTGAWLLETVGGYVPPGESSADVARREALEETGCDVAELEHVCDFYVSPGYSTEQISLFCGHVDAASAGGVHGLPEEGEDILVRVFSADEAIAGLSGGMANSTSLIIGLQWLALHRSELRLRWS